MKGVEWMLLAVSACVLIIAILEIMRRAVQL